MPFLCCMKVYNLMFKDQKLTAIPLELKILATLSFLSFGSYQRRIGQDFLSSMFLSSVSGVIHAVINGINRIMPQWIKFPTLPAHIQTVQEQFWINTNFPEVIGVIDGAHVAIWPPERNREH
ncbi:putative nuclease HARBI1 [Solenopsis invicta]|uniref:putative nuclease HARBI1 n=1 Tax=Solenopsis invicta TaxID=13686 RepID=UPI00193C99DB|nr:putative nuclease HARBI1 [Solenopsis invicta]